MKKENTDGERRKELTQVVEQYIDSMDIQAEDIDRIVQLADEIYTTIKKQGGQKDVESLALTMFMMASVENQKEKKDPYEFAGYA